MKNRRRNREFRKNGKFFCWHNWEACGEVGPNWDLSIGAYVPCKCLKCDQRADIPVVGHFEFRSPTISSMVQT